MSHMASSSVIREDQVPRGPTSPGREEQCPVTEQACGGRGGRVRAETWKPWLGWTLWPKSGKELGAGGRGTTHGSSHRDSPSGQWLGLKGREATVLPCHPGSNLLWHSSKMWMAKASGQLYQARATKLIFSKYLGTRGEGHSPCTRGQGSSAAPTITTTLLCDSQQASCPTWASEWQPSAEGQQSQQQVQVGTDEHGPVEVALQGASQPKGLCFFKKTRNKIRPEGRESRAG